jgi:hypothetical protein
MSSSSDDELDDELMDLGGGGEAAAGGGSKRRMDSSDSDDDSIALSSDESDDDDDAPAAPPKKKKAKAPPKKKAKPAPKKKAKAKPKSKPIALPEDSESDSEEDEDAFNPADDGYDEDFYGDSEDRMRLEAMNEMEREVILDERRTARERAVERAQAARALKTKKKEAARAALPRQQSSRNQKLQRGKSNTKEMQAIADLKKKRAAKAAQESEDESDEEIEEEEEDEDIESGDDSEEEDRRRRQRDNYSDSDSDDDDRGQREEREERQHTPIEFEDFKSIVVGRQSLEKMVHEPYMQDALVRTSFPDEPHRAPEGMFVRVSIGQHESSGTITYRLCEIVAVVDGSKRYTLGKTKTVRKLTVKFGTSEREQYMDVRGVHAFLASSPCELLFAQTVPLTARCCGFACFDRVPVPVPVLVPVLCLCHQMVSSKPPTEEEFLRWQKQMNNDDETILSKEDCQDRGSHYQKKKSQAYTEEMICAYGAAARPLLAASRADICCVGRGEQWRGRSG